MSVHREGDGEAATKPHFIDASQIWNRDVWIPETWGSAGAPSWIFSSTVFCCILPREPSPQNVAILEEKEGRSMKQSFPSLQEADHEL